MRKRTTREVYQKTPERRRPLTAAFVRTIATAGKYHDQHGLILRVTPSGSRQWIWRGTVRGRRVDLGLGGFPYTTLAEARQAAFEYRKLSRAGGDPRALKRDVPTFAEALEDSSHHSPRLVAGRRKERSPVEVEPPDLRLSETRPEACRTQSPRPT